MVNFFLLVSFITITERKIEMDTLKVYQKSIPLILQYSEIKNHIQDDRFTISNTQYSFFYLSQPFQKEVQNRLGLASEDFSDSKNYYTKKQKYLEKLSKFHKSSAIIYFSEIYKGLFFAEVIVSESNLGLSKMNRMNNFGLSYYFLLESEEGREVNIVKVLKIDKM